MLTLFGCSNEGKVVWDGSEHPDRTAGEVDEWR